MTLSISNYARAFNANDHLVDALGKNEITTDNQITDNNKETSKSYIQLMGEFLMNGINGIKSYLQSVDQINNFASSRIPFLQTLAMHEPGSNRNEVTLTQNNGTTIVLTQNEGEKFASITIGGKTERLTKSIDEITTNLAKDVRRHQNSLPSFLQDKSALRSAIRILGPDVTNEAPTGKVSI